MLFDSVDFPRVGAFAGRPVVPGAHDAPGKATQRGRSVTFVTFRASAARTRRLARMRSWSNLCLTFHALGRPLLAYEMEAAVAGYRKRDVWGKSVSGRVELGGWR